MDLVDEQGAAVRGDAKLVLGVHQQQAALCGRALAMLEQRQRCRARLHARTPYLAAQRIFAHDRYEHGAVSWRHFAMQCCSPQ